jgi:hypothetical protein
MSHVLLNFAMKSFLYEFHPEIMKIWGMTFLSGLAKWVKIQYPEVWHDFTQHVKNNYYQGFLSEYL